MSYGKPDLNIILNHVSKELKKLEYGISIGSFDEKRIIKFFLISGIFDKPARSKILNINGSTGYYGCLKCLQKGERIKTKSNLIQPNRLV